VRAPIKEHKRVDFQKNKTDNVVADASEFAYGQSVINNKLLNNA